MRTIKSRKILKQSLPKDTRASGIEWKGKGETKAERNGMAHFKGCHLSCGTCSLALT